MLRITPISAFNDNYIWTIMHPETHAAVIVDPGDAKPVVQFLQHKQLQLAAILITHHHWDHTNGLTDLIHQYGELTIFGPSTSKIAHINHPLKQGDRIHIDALDIHFNILAIPGHTLDHIAYVGMGSLFCGDTLFAGGCGRLFEGSAAQMAASLEKICTLPQRTLIYCAHEYTLKNLQFAMLVEPNNLILQKRLKETETQVKQGKPTLPSNLKLELDTNPFLRYKLDSVRKSVAKHCGKLLSDPISVFAELRKWKDQF